MAQIITSMSPTRTLAVDEVSNTVTYLGFAKPGADTGVAEWQIRKVSKSGSVTLFLFADGDDRYDNEWDNRASLSYS